ncbi:DgyrCDS1820 [Dimorphilus gyrociliatus]|uniref:DgyrCDS1820 n=1 Tax=Dimorphilus gyrociliatus TaxID=2664684 RepID=A0A7I8VAI3_9ANNE|nr:DgyrCDS1820 [Dimorphilus gyrociliatus]
MVNETSTKSPLKNIGNAQVNNTGRVEMDIRKANCKPKLNEKSNIPEIVPPMAGELKKRKHIPKASITSKIFTHKDSAREIIVKIGSSMCLTERHSIQRTFLNKMEVSRIKTYSKLFSESMENKFSCDSCSFKTSFVSLLRHHQEIPHKNTLKQPLCAICGNVFINSNDWKIHMTTSHCVKQQKCLPNNIMNCSDCSFSTYFYNDMAKHLQNCSFKFLEPIDEDVPNKYIRRNDQKVSTVDKNLCKASPERAVEIISENKQSDVIPTTSESAAIVQHGPCIQTKTEIETCEICELQLSNRKALFQHLQQNHQIEITEAFSDMITAPFSCDLCRRKFWSEAGLIEHRKKLLLSISNCSQGHTLSAEKAAQTLLDSQKRLDSNPHNCLICNQQTEEMMKHMLKSHGLALKTVFDEEECHACNNGVKLIFPGSSVEGSSKPPPKENLSKYKCETCKVSFKSNATLLKHKKIMHGFQCSLCSTFFLNEKTKNKHYKEMHESKLQSCPICKKIFLNNKHFLEHAKTYLRKCTVKLTRITQFESDLLKRNSVKIEVNESEQIEPIKTNNIKQEEPIKPNELPEKKRKREQVDYKGPPAKRFCV